MSKARLLADLMSDSQITASEITGLELNAIQEGDTVVEVVDDGAGGKVVVRVDGANNAEFNSGGIVVPSGTTAERDPSSALGSLRYNTTTGFFETFTTSGWGAVATPPSITNISPNNFNGEAGATFTVDGAFFDAASIAVFKGADGTEYAASTVTFVSNTQLTIVNATNLPVANEPFRIKVTNGAGLSAESLTTIDAGTVPTFTTSAGNIATTTNYDDPISVTVQASDAETSITGYTITQGALPTGVTLNSTTGLISGTASEQATTTYTFTIEATDTAGNTNTRQFNIQIVNAPPVWSSPAEGSTTEIETNSASSITLSATDPEGQAVSYTSNSLPAGLSISGNVISGTPTVEASNSVAVTASDGFASSVRNFFINVVTPFQAQFFPHSTSTSTFSYINNTIGTYTVPTTGSYRLLISGARGGRPYDTSYAPSGFNSNLWRGKGRQIEVYYNFEAGEVLKYVIGQEGSINSSGNGGNGGGVGGGGSFLWKENGTVLIGAAGGGGGGSIINTNGSVIYLYGRDGNTANDGLDSHGQDGTGGINGGDGREFLSRGGGAGNANRARGWLSMSAAMNFQPNQNNQYGTYATFGGGGLSRQADHAGGGGGGYSGGGYGDYGHNSGFGNSDGRNGGGGGGSYAIADSRSFNLAFSTMNGHGEIIIEAATS